MADLVTEVALLGEKLDNILVKVNENKDDILKAIDEIKENNKVQDTRISALETFKTRVKSTIVTVTGVGAVMAWFTNLDLNLHSIFKGWH